MKKLYLWRSQWRTINAEVMQNPELIPEYINRIDSYLSSIENSCNVTDCYLASQMRPPESCLQSELPTTMRKKLQLDGEASMLIATKYEKIYAPEVMDFVYITNKVYTDKEG